MRNSGSQRKTPQEIAASTNESEQHEWLLKASIRELQELIHSVATHPGSSLYQWAKTALAVKISEALIESIDRVEASSRRLETHTIWLKYLTAGLLALTAVLSYLTYLLLRVEHR